MRAPLSISGFVLAGVLGCASRGQQARDPFLPPSNRGVTPPPGFPIRSIAPQDSARDVSTSPATDPYPLVPSAATPAPVAGLGPVGGAGSNVFDPPNPPDAKPATSAEAPGLTASAANPPSPQDTQEATTAQLHQSIRRRLDLAGARDLRLEPDPLTGKHKFSCEVPHPGNPELARVFYAVHDDWTKAMLAVADAVEKWVSNQK